MKKDGSQRIYTKDEIIQRLNHFLEVQENIANEKEKEYYAFEKEKQKQEDCTYNPHQKELNNQIKAYGNTAQQIVRVYSSSYDNFEEEDNEEETHKELVD